MSYTCENAIFMACRTTRFFSHQSPVSARACKACCKEIICSDVRFTFTSKAAPRWFVIMPKVSSYMRTRIKLLHKQALHPAGIFQSSKSRSLLVSLASVSRSWIIKELQILCFHVTSCIFQNVKSQSPWVFSFLWLLNILNTFRFEGFQFNSNLRFYSRAFWNSVFSRHRTSRWPKECVTYVWKKLLIQWFLAI